MERKKFSRGFTLIELLIVIAILGILVSIVLVDVRSARNKAKNAKIEADAASLPNAAEIFAGSNGGKYVGVCASQTFLQTVSAVNDAISTAPVCNANDNEWCFCAGLLDTANNFCVDNSGHKSEIASACDACSPSSPVCPP